jgi:hypothetical protein
MQTKERISIRLHQLLQVNYKEERRAVFILQKHNIFVAAAMLSLTDNPESFFSNAQDAYRELKEERFTIRLLAWLLYP